MTPNFGQGANSAIESAAALTNILYDMVHVHHINTPSTTEIDGFLESFSKSREHRCKTMLKKAAFVTRLQARDGLLNVLIGRYIAPYAGDLPASMAGKVMIGAEKLNCVPVTKRSEIGWPRSRKEKGKQSSHVWQRRGWQTVQALSVFGLALGSLRIANFL